eukprot:comp23110_c0_seq1/m.37205 comp23110_c0_seq1/g.37205  ORF comp23110_c0_seq1/g.37205 comp23110_c0_seq1/m.37205 type:complete len:805 (-) comp23110_c0_seq1:727-3141(-)
MDSTLTHRVLVEEQLVALHRLLTEYYTVDGGFSLPTLQLRPKDICLAVAQKLSRTEIKLREIRLNGSTVPAVLEPHDAHFQNYSDLDLCFRVDFDVTLAHQHFQTLLEIVMDCLRDQFPEDFSPHSATIPCGVLSSSYVGKLVKVPNNYSRDTGNDDCWSLISLRNDRGRNLEFKFVHTLRRECEFSMDSFQIILNDTLLQMTNFDEALPDVEVECVYGDYDESLEHLRRRIISIKSPEQVRGGGLLKYCRLLVKGYEVPEQMSDAELVKLESTMCTRFFIDFPTVEAQHNTISACLRTHRFDGSDAVLEFLDRIHSAIDNYARHTTRSWAPTLDMIGVIYHSILRAHAVRPSPYHFPAGPMRVPASPVPPGLGVHAMQPPVPLPLLPVHAPMVARPHCAMPPPPMLAQPIAPPTWAPVSVPAEPHDGPYPSPPLTPEMRAERIVHEPPTPPPEVEEEVASNECSDNAPCVSDSTELSESETSDSCSESEIIVVVHNPPLPEPTPATPECTAPNTPSSSPEPPARSPKLPFGKRRQGSPQKSDKGQPTKAEQSPRSASETRKQTAAPATSEKKSSWRDRESSRGREWGRDKDFSSRRPSGFREKEDHFGECRKIIAQGDNVEPLCAYIDNGIIAVDEFGFFGNHRSEGQTLLMVACKYGRLAIVRTLLEKYKANPNTAGGLGRYTALHYAAFHNHGVVVQALLDHGADPSMLTAEGETAEMSARAQGHDWIAKLLAAKRTGAPTPQSAPATKGGLLHHQYSGRGRKSSRSGSPPPAKPVYCMKERERRPERPDGRVSRATIPVC